MATSYTVFLSENNNYKAAFPPLPRRRRRRKLMGGGGDDYDRDSEPEAENQLAPGYDDYDDGGGREHSSSAVIATKGCE